MSKVGSFAHQLEEAGKCVREVTQLRDGLIVKRRASGATLRQIATEAGLSHTAVAKILAR